MDEITCETKYFEIFSQELGTNTYLKEASIK
jgi:hypothetical protein